LVVEYNEKGRTWLTAAAFRPKQFLDASDDLTALGLFAATC
jgi:hypothetical protein